MAQWKQFFHVHDLDFNFQNSYTARQNSMYNNPSASSPKQRKVNLQQFLVHLALSAQRSATEGEILLKQG